MVRIPNNTPEELVIRRTMYLLESRKCIAPVETPSPGLLKYRLKPMKFILSSETGPSWESIGKPIHKHCPANIMEGKAVKAMGSKYLESI